MCELQPPQERTRGGPSDAHLRTGPDGRVWWIASPGSAQSVAHATQCSGIPAASVCSSGRYPMPPTSAHFATLGNRRLNAVTPDIAGIRRVQAGPYRATPDRLSPRQRRLLCSVRRDVQRRMRATDGGRATALYPAQPTWAGHLGFGSHAIARLRARRGAWDLSSAAPRRGQSGGQ